MNRKSKIAIVTFVCLTLGSGMQYAKASEENVLLAQATSPATNTMNLDTGNSGLTPNGVGNPTVTGPIQGGSIVPNDPTVTNPSNRIPALPPLPGSIDNRINPTPGLGGTVTTPGSLGSPNTSTGTSGSSPTGAGSGLH